MEIPIVFMGTPEFSLPILKSLARAYPVVGVITQPDQPVGRGRTLKPPPVKLMAVDLGIPVIQPRQLREPDAMQQLRQWAPQLIVVAAFGQILRSEVLDLPNYGCINVHASLLPRWRGAAPINAAILHGDSHTGITIMKMDAGLDTGPILSQRSMIISSEDTASSLSSKLALLGSDLLLDILPEYLQGRLQPQDQDNELATYAPMLKKEDGLLDTMQPAAVLARQVRAYHPWPGARINWQDTPLKILRAHTAPLTGSLPGVRIIYQGFPALVTTQDLLVLDEVQPAGKKPMPGNAFLRGAREWATG